jgi:DNA polymerase-3 subunit epsilon
MDFVAIDFETANPKRSSICAIGMVFVRNGKAVERFYSLVRPQPLQFDPFFVSIHGIKEDHVKDAPTFAELWPQIRPKITSPVVAHNAAFDMSALRYALDASGIEYPELDYFCTKVISKLVWPGHPTYALDYVAELLGINFTHHQAEDDARACAQVAVAACKQTRLDSLYAFAKRFDIQNGALFPGGYSPCGVQRAMPAYGGMNPSSFAPCVEISFRDIGLHGAANDPKLRKLAKELRETMDAARALGLATGNDIRQKSSQVLYGKSFVFTGVMMTMSRSDAVEAVKERGGSCQDAVSNATDFLVIGGRGYFGYRSGHKSSKMKRAEALAKAGSAIEILSEADFLAML